MIPFHKPFITEDEVNEVVDSLRSGWITMGPKTIEFENRFREYIGTRNAVSANSCTACLHLALKAIGLNYGDEVIIPDITFTATAEVVVYFQAIPVAVDVEEDTMNMNASEIERKITDRTKAIIPVHFGGQPCDMDEIMEIAKRYGLAVVEDAAHALPAFYKDKKIGTIGDMTCFSFYATKTLSAGEGGMITTENDDWADRMKILRLHGISRDAWKRYTDEGTWYYEVLEAGYKYNMTDLHAAVAIAQLRKLEDMWHQRREIARIYTGAFDEIDEIEAPLVRKDRESAWHLYVIKLNNELLRINRDQFIDELKKKGVGTSVHFIPLHRHPYYRNNFNFCAEDFRVSEKTYQRIISLPIYPSMTGAEIDLVINSVYDTIKKFRR